jgi:dTMP kinase
VTRGRFIAFEGGEGCGKSTQSRRLAARLGAVLTREPGGTKIGEALRAVLLDPGTIDLSVRAETLLMAADRAQHVHEVIAPALDAGRDVVTDRYIGSSLAYQGSGRNQKWEEVRELSLWATDGLWADLTILLDVPPELAARRLGAAPDRFEGEGAEFHERVAEGFRYFAGQLPSWVVIDGSAEEDVVADAVWSAIMARWPSS